MTPRVAHVGRYRGFMLGELQVVNRVMCLHAVSSNKAGLRRRLWPAQRIDVRANVVAEDLAAVAPSPCRSRW